MIYPVVGELAGGGVHVAVACGVLGFSGRRRQQEAGQIDTPNEINRIELWPVQGRTDLNIVYHDTPSYPFLALVPLLMSASRTRPSGVSKVGKVALAIHDAIDWEASEDPDVVLLTARANIHLTMSRFHSGSHILRSQLQRLLDLRTEGRDGKWGWGLPHAWDAFGDGTINPPDAMYSYTTAAAALALVEGSEALRDSSYLTEACRGAAALMNDMCCWRKDNYLSVWYSDQPNDQQDGRVVYNVNGYTLALLSLLDQQLPRAPYGDERGSIASFLIDKQGQGYGRAPIDGRSMSDSNWKYMEGDDRSNDLIHETFIVEGLLAHGTPYSIRSAHASLDEMSRNHFDETGAPRDLKYTLGSLGWGPAAGLHILAQSNQHRHRAGQIAEYLIETVGADGRTTLAGRDKLRAQAWYALGLARYANAGHGSFPD